MKHTQNYVTHTHTHTHTLCSTGKPVNFSSYFATMPLCQSVFLIDSSSLLLTLKYLSLPTYQCATQSGNAFPQHFPLLYLHCSSELVNRFTIGFTLDHSGRSRSAVQKSVENVEALIAVICQEGVTIAVSVQLNLRKYPATRKVRPALSIRHPHPQQCAATTRNLGPPRSPMCCSSGIRSQWQCPSRESMDARDCAHAHPLLYFGLSIMRIIACQFFYFISFFFYCFFLLFYFSGPEATARMSGHC